ncbi:MAG: DUF368 domain-containing protein [Phycisphaerales bacterium]|nr:MAG: DUF368 domain-containing protein [Phycisphaerales bacterium]
MPELTDAIETTDREQDDVPPPAPAPGSAGAPPLLRTGIAGVLMGLANLVPGVSGGTMVLVMGLYDEFVTSVADVTRLRLTRRNVLFLGVLVGVVGVTIAAFSGLMETLVTRHTSAMYALFIGMTLGGAPMLIRMIGRFHAAAAVGCALGLGLMIAIGLTHQEKPERSDAKGPAPSQPASDAPESAAAEGPSPATAAAADLGTPGTSEEIDDPPGPPDDDRPSPPDVERTYARDVVAGALGMSAMVLPGVSGAYMLLILGRYVPILGAISDLKTFVTTGGSAGSLESLHVIIPVGIGAALSLVLFSNLLKWALHRHEKLMLGILLGILIGAVIGIWPFQQFDVGPNDPPIVYRAGDYALGLGLALAGLAGTVTLSRIRR